MCQYPGVRDIHKELAKVYHNILIYPQVDGVMT